jgi:hypothetical protein
MTLEEMNPGARITDGHAERKALGLKDTEATPISLRSEVQSKTSQPEWFAKLQEKAKTAGEQPPAKPLTGGQPDWYRKLKKAN